MRAWDGKKGKSLTYHYKLILLLFAYCVTISEPIMIFFLFHSSWIEKEVREGKIINLICFARTCDMIDYHGHW